MTTLSSFVSQLYADTRQLAEDGSITPEEAVTIEALTDRIVEMLADRLADEHAYYNEGVVDPDVLDPEHDFHALDDAAFEAIEESYEMEEV